MQVINGIQNAIVNANTVIQNGMVVDAANAHRSYLPGFRRLCEAGLAVKRPKLGFTCSKSLLPDSKGSTQSLLSSGNCEHEHGAEFRGTRHCRTWRLDSRHQLPGAAWAMLVLNRSMCG